MPLTFFTVWSDLCLSCCGNTIKNCMVFAYAVAVFYQMSKSWAMGLLFFFIKKVIFDIQNTSFQSEFFCDFADFMHFKMLKSLPTLGSVCLSVCHTWVRSVT